MTVKPSLASTLLYSFRHVKDPRVQGRCRHLLLDILFIAVCTRIAGGEGWEAMQYFGETHQDWLKTDLPFQ